MWAILIIAMLFTQELEAQEKYYTAAQLDESIQRADTVIYQDPRQERPPYEMLSFENRPTAIDWSLDTLARRTLFAVKTNLLYDLLTAVNIELEVPIGDRYSVAGEWIFPWWLSDSRQRCFELLSGTIEGRYWFGDRAEMAQLTGWAAGLYIGAGYYDLEWDGDGYQGEHLLSGGISASYAHSLCGDLRLEYSLGIGFLSTKYRKYSAQRCGDNWLLLRTRSGTKQWFGPTRCRVALSWMLNRADKRGGVL